MAEQGSEVFDREVEIDPRLPDVDVTDPKALDEWINLVVDHPIRAYETATHPDGRPFTPEEQLAATRQNLRGMVDEHHQLRDRPNPVLRGHALSDPVLAKRLRQTVQEEGLTNFDKFPQSGSKKVA